MGYSTTQERKFNKESAKSMGQYFPMYMKPAQGTEKLQIFQDFYYNEEYGPDLVQLDVTEVFDLVHKHYPNVKITIMSTHYGMALYTDKIDSDACTLMLERYKDGDDDYWVGNYDE